MFLPRRCALLPFRPRPPALLHGSHLKSIPHGRAAPCHKLRLCPHCLTRGHSSLSLMVSGPHTPHHTHSSPQDTYAPLTLAPTSTHDTFSLHTNTHIHATSTPTSHHTPAVSMSAWQRRVPNQTLLFSVQSNKAETLSVHPKRRPLNPIQDATSIASAPPVLTIPSLYGP